VPWANPPCTGITYKQEVPLILYYLKKEWHAPSQDPADVKPTPARHQIGVKPTVTEMVILKDYLDAKDWYVAEICQVLSDRFTVNSFITAGGGAPLAGYARATRRERTSEGNFLPAYMVQRQKQRHRNHYPTGSS
jgi:hypothetical protein